MIIGIVGYGYTGASAFCDLLKEYDEIDYVKTKNTFEFSFIYNPDGLFDLEFNVHRAPAKHLKGDWAIRRFQSYIRTYEKSFNSKTNGKFSTLCQQYLDDIIQVKYRRYVTLLDNKYTNYPLIMIKILRKIQFRLLAKYQKDFHIVPKRDGFICVCPDQFVERTQAFVSSVIQALGLNMTKKIMLDQPFPPNDPTQVFHYYDDPYAIVVDRDPRDIYLIVKRLSHLGGSYIPHDSVQDFVEAYRDIRRGQKDNSERIIRVRFEDLIYRYDDTVRQIENFLQLNSHNHVKEFFKPEVSINTTQMYKAFPDEAENIAYIERELSEYLYPFEKYGEVSFDRSDLYNKAL